MSAQLVAALIVGAFLVGIVVGWSLRWAWDAPFRSMAARAEQQRWRDMPRGPRQ